MLPFYFRLALLMMLAVPNVFSEVPKYNKATLNNGWAISDDCFLYILKTLPAGSTILEFGSGSGTGELAKYYHMHSIEHDKNWLNKYHSQYIYAPIRSYQDYQWYDIETIPGQLPKQYDLILVDGPTGTIGREGFFRNITMFNTDGIIIIDDVMRVPEKKLLIDVASYLHRPYEIITSASGKKFGVIPVMEIHI